MLKRFFYIFISVPFAFALMGCTRPQEETSQIQIVVPQNMGSSKAYAQSPSANDSLIHVSINVTGDGMPGPIIFNWDSCHECPNAPAPPTSFKLDIPMGSNRLVQVLAVYQNSTANTMNFYYGDTVQSLSAAQVSITIPIVQVGNGAPVVSGNVGGRYLTGPDSGPTGLVDIKFNPGNGKPALIIDSAFMTNGWFNFFMLSGASFQYVLRTSGEVLWGGDVSLDHSAFDPATAMDRIAKAFIPVHTASRYVAGTNAYVTQEPSISVWGYWGSHATGKKVCTSSVTGSSSKIKQYQATPSSSAPAFTFNHVTNSTTTTPTAAALLDTGSPLTSIMVKGGAVMSGSCGGFADTSANRFLNFLKITTAIVEENGHGSGPGFKGFFISNTSNGAVATITGEPKTIAGTVLPGISSLFDEMRIYKRVGSEEFRMDYPNCHEISTGLMGFTLAGSAAIVVSGDFSISSSINSADVSVGVNAVLCPAKAGVLARAGYFLEKWNFSSGGGGYQSATKLAVSLRTPTAINNTCTPFEVKALDSNNNPGSISQSLQVSLSSTDAPVAIYPDQYCGSPITTSVSMSGESTKTFFVRRETTGSFSSPVAVAATGLTSGAATIQFQDTPGSIVEKLKMTTPTSISPHYCETITFTTWHDDGTLSAILNWSSSYTFTLPSIAGLTFYYEYDANCEYSPVSSVNIGSSYLNQVYRYKYTGALTSLSLQPTGASPVFSGTVEGGASLPVVQPSSPAAVRFSLPSSFAAEACQPGKLEVVDSNGRLSPVGTALNLSYTYNGSGTPAGSSGFYSDSSCTSAFNPTVAVATAQTSFYFRWTAPGTLNLSATVTSGPAVTVEPIAINVGSFELGSLVAVPGNATYDFITDSYTAPAKMVHESDLFPMTIYAYSPLGNLVTSFATADAGPSGINLDFSGYPGGLTCNSINWISGVGTTNCSYQAASEYFSTHFIGFATGGGSTNLPFRYLPSSVRIMRVANSTTHHFKMASRPFNYTSGQCQPVLLGRGPNGGNFYLGSKVVGSSVSEVLTTTTPSAGIAGYYLDPACTTALPSSTVTMIPGETAKIIYLDLAGTSPNGYTSSNYLTIFDPFAGATTGFTATGVSTFSKYEITTSKDLFYGACVPMMLARTDSAGGAIAAPGSEVVNISADFTAGFYSDPNCATLLPGTPQNISFSSPETAKLLYVKPLNPNITNGTITATNGTQSGSAVVNVAP